MPVRVPRMGLRQNRLGEATGALLTEVPDGFGHRRSGRCGLLQSFFQAIQPLVKALVQALASGGPLCSCTDLLKHDNLSSSHG
jgi:hypothetical protein